MRRVVVFAGLGLALAGCALAGIGKGPPSTGSLPPFETEVSWPNSSSAWAAKAHPDVPRFSFLEGWGLVLATPRVLASFPNGLAARPGPNRTVEECKRQIELGAARYGKAVVEAASLGEEQRTEQGLYEGLVEIRIVYDFGMYDEVRQAILKCYSDPDGSFVDMRVVSPASAGNAPEVPIRN
jgi:hypothetical protein